MSGKPKDRTVLRFTTPLEPGRYWATREARELFKRITGEWPHGHFLECDRADLEVYVLAVIEARDMESAIASEGAVLKRKDGTLYANPRALIRDRAWVRIRDAGAKLRLHLSSRMRSEAANAAANQPGAGARRPWEMDGGAKYFGTGDDAASYLAREEAHRRRMRKANATEDTRS